MSRPKPAGLRRAVAWLRAFNDPEMERAILVLEEHAALVAAVRAAIDLRFEEDRGTSWADYHRADKAYSEALASELVQRALQRDTESASRAESEVT